MEVAIKRMPELRLAAVRHRGPYNQISVAFEELGRRLGPASKTLHERGSAMVAIYHDDPEMVPLDQLRSDAAVTLPADFALPPGVAEERVPAGDFACTLHVGPYEELGDVWARFMGEWLPSSGRRVGAGPSFEIYLNDPSRTPKAELRTELYLPLA